MDPDACVRDLVIGASGNSLLIASSLSLKKEERSRVESQ